MQVHADVVGAVVVAGVVDDGGDQLAVLRDVMRSVDGDRVTAFALVVRGLDAGGGRRPCASAARAAT